MILYLTQKQENNKIVWSNTYDITKGLLASSFVSHRLKSSSLSVRKLWETALKLGISMVGIGIPIGLSINDFRKSSSLEFLYKPEENPLPSISMKWPFMSTATTRSCLKTVFLVSFSTFRFQNNHLSYNRYPYMSLYKLWISTLKKAKSLKLSQPKKYYKIKMNLILISSLTL